MKPARSIMCAAMAVAMASFPLTSQAAGPATEVPKVAGPATKPVQRVDALIEVIRQAQDPSAAIQAYHDASTQTLAEEPYGSDLH